MRPTILTTVFTLGLAAAVAAPTGANAQTASDPWEGANRDLFAIHESVDRAVLEPVARGYRAVTNEPVREGVRNVLSNLRGPVVFANDVLQGEVSRAGTTAARFGINSTLGLAGVFDPASSFGLERHDEDFGQTLAVWGVGAGPYIFVPVLGPTTVRDSLGRVADMAFDPLSWAAFSEADEARIIRGATTGVSAREGALEAVDSIRSDSLDPYVSIRSSYELLRQSAIQNGPGDVQDLPEFEDISSEPAADTPPEPIQDQSAPVTEPATQFEVGAVQ